MTLAGNAPPRIRDAATIILWRDIGGIPHVLMGQRGAKASFMPSKYVFPGGALDPNDEAIELASPLPDECTERLSHQSACSPQGLAACAIRELWEETGQILGSASRWPDAPKGWRGFAQTGSRPDGRGLSLIFRAITPPGNSRRFDARFFLAPATALLSDPDDFSRAEDELSHLHWVSLADARQLDLPFITKVVLAELVGRFSGKRDCTDAPFIRNEAALSSIEWLTSTR